MSKALDALRAALNGDDAAADTHYSAIAKEAIEHLRFLSESHTSVTPYGWSPR